MKEEIVYLKEYYTKDFFDLIGVYTEVDHLEYETKLIENSLNIEKPCYKLKHCPYGYMVEHFPFLPTIKSKNEEWISNMQSRINNNEFDEDEVKKWRGRIEEAKNFFTVDSIPDDLQKMRCKIFGHLCPVYFLKEDTKEEDDEAFTQKLKEMGYL